MTKRKKTTIRRKGATLKATHAGKGQPVASPYAQVPASSLPMQNGSNAYRPPTEAPKVVPLASPAPMSDERYEPENMLRSALWVIFWSLVAVAAIGVYAHFH